GRVEGGEQQLQHLDGAGGGLLDRGEGGQEPPQHEETGDGRHRVERFFGVDFLDLFTHPRRPPLTNFFSSAFRPTVKIVPITPMVSMATTMRSARASVRLSWIM